MSRDLTLREMHDINVRRCHMWHDPMGWTPERWTNALAGEVGELCNITKKMARARDDLVGNKETPEELESGAKTELGDVFLYWLLTCHRLGIDPQDAAVSAFNEKFIELGFDILMPE